MVVDLVGRPVGRARWRCATFAVLALLGSGAARADGGMAVLSSEGNHWLPHPEKSQFATLALVDGREEMILAIETRSLRGRGVWVFPVPAEPSAVRVAIAPGFPEVLGADPRDRMGPLLEQAMLPVIGQPFPTLPALALLRPASELALGGSAVGGGGVTGAARLASQGLTLELLSASDRPAFERHLAEQGLALPPAMAGALEGYLGQRYSLLVAWLSDDSAEQAATEVKVRRKALSFGPPKARDGEEEDDDARLDDDGSGGTLLERHKTLAVQASFPATRLWFPLKLTSMYGAQVIPATLYACGAVEPRTYPGIERFVRTRRLVDPGFRWWSDEPHATFECKDPDGLFTRVVVRAPSSALAEDLELEPAHVPWTRAKLRMARAFEDRRDGHPLANGLGWRVLHLALLSMVSSAVAAAVVYRRCRPRLGFFALLGLANLLTLVAFAASAAVFRVTRNALQAPTPPGRRGWTVPLVWALLGGLPVVAMALAGPMRLGASASAGWANALLAAVGGALFLGLAAWDALGVRGRTAIFVAVFSLTLVSISCGLTFLVAA
ncbi:MAG: hypothetical protein QM765_28930 [Myxococcales bacterium]